MENFRLLQLVFHFVAPDIGFICYDDMVLAKVIAKIQTTKLQMVSTG